MKKRLGVTLFILILMVVFLAASGCATKTGNAPDSEPVPAGGQEQPAEPEPPPEEPESPAGPLDGLADNSSAENSISYQGYIPFSQLALGITLEEAVGQLTSAGMVVKKELEDTLFDTQSCQYGFPEEIKDVYIQLESFEGTLIKKTYLIVLHFEPDTGFYPTKTIYNAMLEKMKEGSVTTLAEVEAYFGPSYLYIEGFKDKEAPGSALNRTYRWRGNKHYIDVFTDETDTLTGFKIGSSALPE